MNGLMCNRYLSCFMGMFMHQIYRGCEFQWVQPTICGNLIKQPVFMDWFVFLKVFSSVFRTCGLKSMGFQIVGVSNRSWWGFNVKVFVLSFC